jgi:integrase
MRAAKGEGSVVASGKGYRGYVPTEGGGRKYTSVYPTKALAAQAKRALLNQRDDGVLAAGKSPTLSAWLAHWLVIRQAEAKPLRASTLSGYRYSIDHYINTGLGGKLGATKLDKLTMEHLETFYREMSDNGMKGSVIHQCHAIIRVSLKYAVWRGKVNRNVALLVRAPSVQRGEARSLSEADVDRIFEAAEGDRYEARWALALDFGLRPGEANAIEWQDLNFETGILRVHQQLQQINGRGLILVPLPKTVKGDREIWLPDYLLDLLRKRRMEQYAEMIEEGSGKRGAGGQWKAWEWEGQPRSLIFTQRNGSAIPPRLDTTNWHKLLVAAGVPATKRYTGRHTAASMMIANGVDPATVSETLGHSTVAFTLGTYVHAVKERKEDLAVHFQKRSTARREDKVQAAVQATPPVPS